MHGSATAKQLRYDNRQGKEDESGGKPVPIFQKT